MLFKVWGERNSGTSFLSKILSANFGEGRVHTHSLVGTSVNHWVHGIPDSRVKLLDNWVIDIFVLRDLETWLPSMFKNHYELNPFEDFEKFLTEKQTIYTSYSLYDTQQPLNGDDQDKTIFEIRYHKYKHIIDYLNKNDDVLLVSLDFIQNEISCRDFLKIIKYNYAIPDAPQNEIVSIDTHLATLETITEKSQKNRKYFDIEPYRDIIDDMKDIEIENEINNLTLKFKYRYPNV
tara:strand:- start:132 stop:836 length:705 start_codon:yes stop_codon:yes gene_type:complete